MIYLNVIAGLFALDQIVKKQIETQPDEVFPHSLDNTKDFITIHKSHNHGMMMGFLNGRSDLPKWIPFGTILAIGSYFLYILSHKGKHLTKLSLALILGGALSNVADRFHYGYVVDYFSVNIKKLKHIVFNLGDFFIFGGTFLLLIYELFQDMKSSS